MNTTINHKVRIALGLSCDQYVFLDFIAQKKGSKYSDFERSIGYDKQMVQSIFQSLKGSDLIDCSDNKISVTKKWMSCFDSDKFAIIPDVINYLNVKANTSYKASSKKSVEHIRARINDGFTLEDFQSVIDAKCIEWLATDMSQYLRPETLFGTKFEGYLQASKMNKKPVPANKNMAGMIM